MDAAFLDMLTSLTYRFDIKVSSIKLKKNSLDTLPETVYHCDAQ